ncbi:MAG: BrnT family toxin [Beijerinckiaceae bacterium]
MIFGWHEGKRLYVLEDRSIDFEDMVAIFDGRPRLTAASPQKGEDRFVSVGEINGKFFAVVWMWREETIWIVTARRARAREEQAYRKLLTEQDNDRED